MSNGRWRTRVGRITLGLLGVALLAAACGGGSRDFDDPRLLAFDNELTTPGQLHQPLAVYPTTPPYGGPHASQPTPCGIYREEQPFASLIHTMEHGGVIWYYHPDAFRPAEVEQMQALATTLLDDDERLVFTPNRQIESQIALTAWGYILPLDQFEADTIQTFVTEFENRVGTEKLPRSQAC